MANEQAIINELLNKRAIIERECLKIELEYERIVQKRAAFTEQLKALDTVISVFSNDEKPDLLGSPVKNEAETGESIELPQQIPVQTNGHAVIPRKRSGLKSTARKYFRELPHEYDKHNITTLLLKHHPGMRGKSVNQNTVSGIMRNLVEMNMAKVKIPATGRAPQVYEKII